MIKLEQQQIYQVLDTIIDWFNNLKNIHEWIILKLGDAELARKVMKRLGYSKDQIYTAGEDVYNYQGVGCPHTHAAISSGQCLRL